MLLKLVPDADVFREALRAVKRWARTKGLYSNVRPPRRLADSNIGLVRRGFPVVGLFTRVARARAFDTARFLSNSDFFPRSSACAPWRRRLAPSRGEFLFPKTTHRETQAFSFVLSLSRSLSLSLSRERQEMRCALSTRVCRFSTERERESESELRDAEMTARARERERESF